MSFKIPHVVLALLVGVVLGLGASRLAGHRRHHGGSLDKRIERLGRKLELTPEQKAKVRSVFEEGRVKIDAVRADSRGKIRAALNESQRAKFDAMMARHDAKHPAAGEKR